MNFEEIQAIEEKGGQIMSQEMQSSSSKFDQTNQLAHTAETAAAEVEGLFEEEHVQQVYEAIAPHFSATRYKRWPIVEKFIKSLPKGSFGCDFGCGNGKNLENDSDGNIMTIGMDACNGLLGICNEKGFEVALGTILKDPFRSKIFDFSLSIAVIHHLRTRSRRLQSIKEMIRVMRTGARGLIFVWAFEENKSVRRHKLTVLDGDEQDVLVPWSMNEFKDKDAKNQSKRPKIDSDDQAEQAQPAEPPELFQRYYHLFKKGELDDLVVEAGGKIIESDYDRDNYFIIFEK